MFTGLIESTGLIRQITANCSGAVVSIESDTLDYSDISLGDSIAVNGVCLTAIELGVNRFTADVSSETLSRTCFGVYQVGQVVNLEKALLPTTRLGGHLVSGHVDGMGEVVSMTVDGNFWQLIIRPPEALQRYIAEKGSICVDGISLTVNELIGDNTNVNVSKSNNSEGNGDFRLTIVPHSMNKTLLAIYQPGTRVNLEVDLLARYLERLLTFSHENTQQPPAVTLEKLRDCGFD